MSGNNSLSDLNSAPDSTLASEYALRVALQTIKERCVSLQQRLALVEEENLTIKTKLCTERAPRTEDSQSECESLRERVAKVTKEKLQLSEHIEMVTTENRQLWSRLSQLVKDQNNRQKKPDTADQGSSGTAQRLIRSETFTQHSPNVLLRPKPVIASAPAAATEANDECNSMEDVSLKNFGDYLDEKYGNSNRVPNARTTLNFGYLNEDASRLGDFSQDLNGCTTGMQDMNSELKKQQTRLKTILDSLRERRANPLCPECRKRKEKPETADKGLETDDCIRNTRKFTIFTQQEQQRNLDSYDGSTHINILEEKRLVDEEQKRLADGRAKMCPLCGKIHSDAVSFDDFRKHVETHFIDDIEIDPNSLENTFEFLSNTVGNF